MFRKTTIAGTPTCLAKSICSLVWGIGPSAALTTNIAPSIWAVPVIITVYKDKKFDFVIKSPPASHFIKEAAKLKSGSQEPGRNIVASITKKQAEEIAKKKMEDLNAHDIDEAVKIIAGSARSMGIEVKD